MRVLAWKSIILSSISAAIELNFCVWRVPSSKSFHVLLPQEMMRLISPLTNRIIIYGFVRFFVCRRKIVAFPSHTVLVRIFCSPTAAKHGFSRFVGGRCFLVRLLLLFDVFSADSFNIFKCARLERAPSRWESEQVEQRTKRPANDFRIKHSKDRRARAFHFANGYLSKTNRHEE